MSRFSTILERASLFSGATLLLLAVFFNVRAELVPPDAKRDTKSDEEKTNSTAVTTRGRE